jgi:serine/threonine-protein kinase HipA
LWLNEEYGPVDAIEAVLRQAPYFRLSEAMARRIIGQVYTAVKNWKTIAKSVPVGMTEDDIDAFSPAFENEQMVAAAGLLT